MIVTVHNATGNICPIMSRPTALEGAVNCEACACMAWRWADEIPPTPIVVVAYEWKATAEPPRPPKVTKSWIWIPYEGDNDTPACWVEDDLSIKLRREGYCGLAGTPLGD